jgi:hypothetical protein
MRVRGKTFMTLGAMIVAAWATITALKWPLKTALFPVVVGIPFFLMATIELFLTLSGKDGMPRKDSPVNAPPPEEERESLPAGKTVVAFLLVMSLFALILLVGFVAGITLFVFLYLKVYGKERWGISLVLTAAACASIYGLFVRILNIPFPAGWVVERLRSMGIG